MARAYAARLGYRTTRRRRLRAAALGPRARSRRRALRAFRAVPLAVQLFVGVVAVVVLWYAANWVVQVVRKPTELFFPVSGTLNKAPAETWRQYEPLFREHSTVVITPELLAALAQVEGAGNPVARTYWRWRLTWSPFDLYRPASSAAGMYQITDATFREAKRYCIRNHAVVEEGPCTTRARAGSTGFTRASCRATRSSSPRRCSIARSQARSRASGSRPRRCSRSRISPP